jgi:hypothetical protein
MLKKGHLIDVINDCEDANIKQSLVAKLEAIEFPHLSASDVSAFFIKNDGPIKTMTQDGSIETMMQDDPNGRYLYDDKIEYISELINRDYRSVRDLLKEAKSAILSSNGTKNV